VQRVLLKLSKRYPKARESALRTLGRANVLVLDYPVDPQPRWGHGQPDHPQLLELLARAEPRYLHWIERFSAFGDGYRAIAVDETADPRQPFWSNRMMSGLDAAAIYALIGHRQPERYVEVGSGNSTKFARQAISDFGLATRITSIDPHPRAEIDELCDEVIRAPFETVDLGLFAELGPRDLVLVDNSHRVLQNSDATVAFLDLLPIVPAGVMVGIDDIFLPADYPPEWRYRYYSEQYALAAFLLGGHSGYAIELPVAYLTRTSSLAPTVREQLRLPVGVEGNTFWMSRAA
jgi:hypothetical protein